LLERHVEGVERPDDEQRNPGAGKGDGRTTPPRRDPTDTQLFNLTVIDADFGERGVGIWDGESFLFQTTTIKSRWSGWWDTVAALKRYGAVSPYRQRTAVRDLLKRFANLYNADWLAKRGAVGSIEEFAQTADLGNDLTTTNGEKWATETVGVNERWWSEIMEASTRVNVSSTSGAGADGSTRPTWTRSTPLAPRSRLRREELARLREATGASLRAC